MEIINDITKRLVERNVQDIRFIVTLDDFNYDRLFKNNQYVINVGYTKPQDCPSLYANSDAMFLPTLAECFSASYPEAMKMQVPIITSDLPFAHSICKNAAIYVNPFDADEICDKIITLKDSESLKKQLINFMNIRFADFPNASERCKNYLTICNELYNEK